MQLTGLVLVLLLGGCSSTPDANSPVGMEYSGGTLVSVEAATFQQVWRAASAALDDADVTILDRQKIENGGKLDGRTPDLQAVRVTVRVLTENKTELRIRIDSLGNSELARRIYARFKIALGPTPVTAADASDLCLTCGLCCDGTLFGDVELQAGDDRARLRALGLPVIRSRSGRRPSRWLQPCPALGAGCRCAIYRERPHHCREFDCALLQSVKAGALAIADARRTIRQTRRRVETVKRLLRELGDTQEHDSLAKRFRRTRRRFENQELAEAPDREERLDRFAALTMAVHELQFALRLAFYPDPGDGNE